MFRRLFDFIHFFKIMITLKQPPIRNFTNKSYSGSVYVNSFIMKNQTNIDIRSLTKLKITSRAVG